MCHEGLQITSSQSCGNKPNEKVGLAHSSLISWLTCLELFGNWWNILIDTQLLTWNVFIIIILIDSVKLIVMSFGKNCCPNVGLFNEPQVCLQFITFWSKIELCQVKIHTSMYGSLKSQQ